MSDSSPEQSVLSSIPYLAASLLAWVMPAGVFIFGTPGFVGADPYFHAQISRAMTTGGLAWTKFPWATESIWVNAWFDKDWLFHLLLAPFASWDRILGAKLFVLLAVVFVGVSAWLAFRAAGQSCRQSAFWSFVLPWTCYGIFWFRLSVCRPHVLSIGFFALVLAFTLKRRPLALAATAFLYTLSHASHWQLLAIVLFYDALEVLFDCNGRRRKKWEFRTPLFLYAFAGVVIATLIHPAFPINVRGLFVQNVLVLFSAGTGGGATARIGELQPAGWRILLLLAPIFVAGIFATGAYLHARQRPSRQVLFLAVCTIGYLGLATFALRFLDYAVPIAVLCLAAAWGELKDNLSRVFTVRRLGLGFALATLVFGGFGYRRLYLQYYTQPEVTHARAGRWLREHLLPGEIVFVTRFHDNGILWFHAPDQRFLVFLDPIFMQQYSNERYMLWEQIRRGQHPDPVAAITGIFGSRVVFLIADPRVPDPEKNAELKLVKQLEEAGAKCVSENHQTGARVYLLSQYPLRRKNQIKPEPGPKAQPDE